MSEGGSTPTNACAEAPGGAEPSPREPRRQVVIDVLANALIDLLLEERSRVRGEHEATTC